jgi:hypothetical protein
VVVLVVGIAAFFGVAMPRLMGDATARARTLATMKRKLETLRDFALFRSRGDKAVLRWGEGAHPKDKTDTSAPHRQRQGPASDNGR